MTWDWSLLDAGRFRLDGGSMFGVVPKAMWSKLVEPDSRNRLPYGCNCVLLERGKEKILIECGYGEGWPEKDISIFDMNGETISNVLEAKGVAPEAIDMVILSHLHFDHAAGISLLPNATVVIQSQEWEDAKNNKSTMSKTYLSRVLDNIQPRVHLVEGASKLKEGIQLTPRIGHTWGLQSIEFETESGTVCFASDVIPTHNHVGPAFSMGYDMLPWDNQQTKHALLTQAYEERWTIVLYHDLDCPIATVSINDSGQFFLVPIASH